MVFFFSTRLNEVHSTTVRIEVKLISANALIYRPVLCSVCPCVIVSSGNRPRSCYQYTIGVKLGLIDKYDAFVDHLLLCRVTLLIADVACSKNDKLWDRLSRQHTLFRLKIVVVCLSDVDGSIQVTAKQRSRSRLGYGETDHPVGRSSIVLLGSTEQA